MVTSHSDGALLGTMKKENAPDEVVVGTTQTLGTRYRQHYTSKNQSRVKAARPAT
jgi:hypothetical protein